MEKIADYLHTNQATVSELADHFALSRQFIHRLLNKMLTEGSITKLGRPPKVYYSAVDPATTPSLPKGDATYSVSNRVKELIDTNFLYISSFGQRQSGWEGFVAWCTERQQDITRMATRYQETIEKYSAYKKNDIIDGMAKLQSTLDDVALDEVFYLDFYSFEIFGKTKLGQLLLFAKQSQDKVLMDQLIAQIRPAILEVIERFHIDGVAFIPPTVKREQQLMKRLEKGLHLQQRIISLVKVKTPVMVPQKTLNRLEDRITNARETIVVDDRGLYNNILLLDDAVGSGATLNEVAKKIRQKQMCTGRVVGLAITGSVKGFDVISEV